MVTQRRCHFVPEEQVVQIPYTTCRMVPEERSEVVRCRRVHYVPEERSYQVPYVTCRLVPEERVQMVPHTTCTMQPYCVMVKVCRQVPVCVPVCEPCCPPGPTSCKPGSHEWFARLLHRAGCVSPAKGH